MSTQKDPSGTDTSIRRTAQFLIEGNPHGIGPASAQDEQNVFNTLPFPVWVNLESGGRGQCSNGKRTWDVIVPQYINGVGWIIGGKLKGRPALPAVCECMGHFIE